MKFGLWALAAAGALTPAGCNIVGPAAYFALGPEKTPAAFELPQERTAVVFVDDRKSRVPRRALRVAIGEEIERTILREKLVADVVSTQSAMQAAGRDGSSGPTPVTEIGRAVKADVVVFATIDQFSLSADGVALAPIAVARVRVIDAVNEKRLWPALDEGTMVTTTMPARPGAAPTNVGEVYKAEDELARALGADIARLFYKHVPERPISTPQ